MKKLILTLIFFVIDIFKSRKVELTKPKDYYLKKQLQNKPVKKKVKIKRYRNNS